MINSYRTIDLNSNLILTFKREMLKVKVGQGWQWKVLHMMYEHAKFDRLIIHCSPAMDLNANLHLTLKQEMLKVKVEDEGFYG